MTARRRTLIALGLALTLLCALAAAGLGSAVASPAAAPAIRFDFPALRFDPWPAGLELPAATEPAPFLTARVVEGVSLRERPGGEPIVALDATTEFGSPQTLAVVEERGDWLGVTTPELGNGALGWVRRSSRMLDLAETRFSIRVDVSRRVLALLRGDQVLRRVPVAVGGAGSSTPLGRFAVTDKIPGGRYGSYYGCCILALSARQANLPEGWTGGDRIAIHGTDDPSSIGAASSAGCLRAADDDLRALMRRVPLGTPVFIHP